MAIKQISSPPTAAYPLVVKKTFIAPNDPIQAGERVYEIEDAQGRRVEVKSPIYGIIRCNPIATGVPIEAPSIILKIEETLHEAVFETQGEPAKTPPPPQSETKKPEPAPEKAPKAVETPPQRARALASLSAVALSVLCVWLSLHITHSLAPDWIRYSALALALIAPFVLSIIFPGKRNEPSIKRAYLQGCKSGLCMSIILYVIALLVPIQWIAKIDNNWVHQQCAPITESPWVQLDETLYFLGTPMKNIENDVAVGLSNGGCLQISKPAISLAGRETGRIWNASGEEAVKFHANKIRVGIDAQGNTRIILFELPSGTNPMTQNKLPWSYRVLDNTGILVAPSRQAKTGSDRSDVMLPEEFSEEALSYNLKKYIGEPAPRLVHRN